MRMVRRRRFSTGVFELQLNSFPLDECQVAYKLFDSVDPPFKDCPCLWALIAYRNANPDGSSNLISYLLPVEIEPGEQSFLLLSPYTLTPLRCGHYEPSGGPLRDRREDLTRFLLLSLSCPFAARSSSELTIHAAVVIRRNSIPTCAQSISWPW